MYGGALKPGDPRRFLVEAIVGAMQADGVVTPEELETLDRNLQEHEVFGGLTPEITKMLVDMANESIAFAGDCRRRLPYMAKGMPSRTHRMAAYAVACEIALADGESPPEVLYLSEMKKHFLLGDEEALALYNAAKKKRAMAEVEERTRQLQGMLPWYLEAMALMAAEDGNVTYAEREAMLGVLRTMGDMSVLGERELQDQAEAAFRRIEGKEVDREAARIARALETHTDRYWAAVYAMIMAIADGKTDWRKVFFLGSLQDALRLNDADMDKAMATANLFPIAKAIAAGDRF
jgi:tellurite resistance protein